MRPAGRPAGWQQWHRRQCDQMLRKKVAQNSAGALV